jgi:lysophospholipase L1-like esterase
MRVALVALAICAVEFGLRASGTVGHELRSNPSTRYGYGLVPGQELRSERGVSLSINSAGFRDREWTEIDTGTTRIAVLGDSVTFGRDVAPADVWCRKLETELHEREGRAVEVRNFAVPGYVMEQYERVFEDFVAPTRPAIVVVTVAPYSIWPMQVRADSAFVPLRRWILRTAIFEGFDKLRREIRDEPVVVVRRDAHGAYGSDPFAAEHAALWDAALERLERMRDAASTWNGRLVLVPIPLLESIFEPRRLSRFEAWARVRPDVVWIDPNPALTAAMEPLLGEMKERQLSDDDVWKRHRRDAPDTRIVNSESAVFFLDDRFHMNERGHGVVAATIHAALSEANLP